MKEKKSAKERRLFPRVRKQVKFKFKMADDLVAAETIDLSGNGALCRTNTYLPPMSRLSVLLALSYDGKTEFVSLNGVVVRVDKEEIADSVTADAFQVAIFFEEIEEHERNIILRHINGDSEN